MCSAYRFTLEKGSKKHYCPTCNKKRFVRYVDTSKGEYLPFPYGKCDRIINCGASFNPYADGFVKSIIKEEQGFESNYKYFNFQPQPMNKQTFFIPDEVLKNTLQGYEENKFINNLFLNVPYPFNKEDIEKIISMYYLGTITKGYRKGAITFPFIDINNKIRAIQVKQFDENNHTVSTGFLHSMIEKQLLKENKNYPEWLVNYLKNDSKVTCLFGEHLLRLYPNNTVALVEAPKSAIYGNLYFGFPDNNKNLIWLAVYNLSSLNVAKCKALQGRKVVLFPDLSKESKAFELWKNKAEVLQNEIKGATFKVSDMLEQIATEQDKEQGKDIADFLIQHDWRLFRK